MKKYVIRNYGSPRQISCEAGNVTILHDGVIETDDKELMQKASNMDAVHVTTRKKKSGPPKPSKPVEETASKPIEEMNVKELKKAAEAAGIKLPGNARKDEIIDLLMEEN